MRRFLSVPLAAILCLAAASAASAGTPVHELIVSPPLEFGAGEMCDFPLLIETTSEHSKVTTFGPGPDGSQRIVTRGVATNLATNLDTGETLTGRGGYRIS